VRLGVAKERVQGERRVALVPDTAKKLIKKGLRVVVEASAGLEAGYDDDSYRSVGADIGDPFDSQIVFKVRAPLDEEISKLKQGTLLLSLLEPFARPGLLEKLAGSKVDMMALEYLPRTSRAQSMDVLSSQAGIAGYRAVIEAVSHFGRFCPMMMTSAGMVKPARIIILGAGVAGLQAIATSRKFGAQVEAFDVRAEVKEQILSLGAKFIDLQIGEEGSGSGGYAKELSADAQKRQQLALAEKLKTADIVISTANIPGKKAPCLILEEAVKGMRRGSVIVDMAAASGGNCPLSEPDKIIQKYGVTLVGLTNFPALMPSDASLFFGNNLTNLLALVVENKDGKNHLHFNLEDDIVNACLVSSQGQVRRKS
jgi:H+-translocating NAD(P) transhydrogenase subunit alpha